ncbi:hypothetical protein [Pedobacter frigidisoli]|uniref:hypothetical protein n=1 Tax=Pedobacter frigidisoli TaxID=2530455 RepID=UPI002930E7E5|nr:hypothetical protein [Pedobacter frigidisoli]
MNENIDNNDWRKEAPSLAARVKNNPFITPDHYFESVEDSVASAIFLDRLKQETNENLFEVPQDYFEALTERIETQIRLSEISLPQNTFEVPENYFDSLQNRITSRIEAEQPKPVARIIPLWRRNIVKYASAACFILMASFGAYFYQNDTVVPLATTNVSDLANEQLLYDIDENTIIEHLEADTKTSSNNASASDTEVENYILSNFSSSDLTHALNN